MSKYATALLSGVAILTLPALAYAQSLTSLEPEAASSQATVADVIVTGSNIRRAAAEGFNPVQVIAKEELENSGKVTVADLLRSISANTGNSSNETSNSGWASGSAGIGLRGLSQKNTLVLLNGRRVSGWEELRSIPPEAIQAHREKLPQMATFVYPADHAFNREVGHAYDPDSAALALQRTLDFFSEHLG